jgi:hypothetical protein
VLMEVASGEWCPGALRHVGPAQRQALESRGYTVGGPARNYQKEIVVDSAMSAETAAREVLHILFEVFGYRGQWRLEITRHRGERADHKPVYTNLTPDDFVKIARRAGCEATVGTDEDRPVVAVRRGRRAFLAAMHWRTPDRSLYALISLQGELTLRQPVTDEAIAQVNSSLHMVKVCRLADGHTVRLQMPLVLTGGVTAAWMAQSLRHWISSWRACERELRRIMSANPRPTSQGADLVH